MHHHRSGSLKQSNKAHKATHSSKRDVDKGNHGRVEKTTGSSATGILKNVKAASAAAHSTQQRVDRMNHAKQILAQKRAEQSVLKRLAGGFGPPKNVSVVGLSSSARPESVVSLLLAQADDACVSRSTSLLGEPVAALYTAHRQRVLLNMPPRAGMIRPEPASAPGAAPVLPFVYDVSHTLAGIKAADVLVVVVNLRHGKEAAIDTQGDVFLSALRATGVPSVIGVLQGLEAHPASKAAELRKYGTRLLETEFSLDGLKIVEAPDILTQLAAAAAPMSLAEACTVVAKDNAAMHLLRALCSIVPRTITWRSNRSYLVAQHAEFTPAPPAAAAAAASEEPTGTLRVHGYLRGRPLNVHQLVCIPGGGVYQVEQITESESPFRNLGKEKAGTVRLDKIAIPPAQDPAAPAIYRPLSQLLGPFSARVRMTAAAAGGDAHALAVSRAEEQETLDTVAEGDALAGEQTWLNDDDMGGDDTDDEDEEGEGEDGSDGSDSLGPDGGAGGGAEDAAKAEERAKRQKAEAAEERERLKDRRRRKKLGGKDADEDDADGDDGHDGATMAGGDDDWNADEMRALAGQAVTSDELLRQRRAAAAEQALFPDEIDTPIDEPARLRFQRYRGLKSVRSTPWDPRENLPPAYSRIFEPARFTRLQQAVLARSLQMERALVSLESQRAQQEKARTKQAHHASIAKKAAARHAASRTGSTVGGSVRGDAEPEADEVEGMSDAAPAMGGAGGPGPVARVTVGSMSDDGGGEEEGEEEVPTLSDVFGADWVSPGQYVCIHLSKVAASVCADISAAPGVPLVLWSLLKHENRTTVMQYTITRFDGIREGDGSVAVADAASTAASSAAASASAAAVGAGTDVIKSKDHLEFHVGHRIFDARPLFAADSLGSDRVAFQRYLQSGMQALASAYAPITYSPTPVLVFRRVPVAGPATAAAAPLEDLYPCNDRVRTDVAGRNYRLQLVATGSVTGADASRVILKRIVLTGFPVKVKRRFAVVRYMFFSPDDINWFKSIELYTKHGLKGHIREAVGTHGNMKVLFDQPVEQHDTVCMALYKRVFPRFGAGYKKILGTGPA